MTAPVKAGAHDSCGARSRSGKPCARPAGWGTDHVGQGKCKLHGGATPIKHGRYSTIQREDLRTLIERHEADPDPLNILPELAAARALFQNFIERYDQWAAALIDWHQSYDAKQRPIDEAKVLALAGLLDDFEDTVTGQTGELTSRQASDLQLARELVAALQRPWVDDGKPRQILDIADAYRIVAEVTKIVERIERIRAANAISRPDLFRLMGEMGRVVETHVKDPGTLEQIRRDWLAIRVA